MLKIIIALALLFFTMITGSFLESVDIVIFLILIILGLTALVSGILMLINSMGSAENKSGINILEIICTALFLIAVGVAILSFVIFR